MEIKIMIGIVVWIVVCQIILELMGVYEDEPKTETTAGEEKQGSWRL